MVLKVSQRTLINWILAALLIIFGLLSFQIRNVVLLSFLTLAVSVVNFWKSRKNVFHLVIYGFILFCNYSICVSLYINPIDGIYTSLVHTEYGRISICILFLFNSLLWLLNTSMIREQDCSELFIKDENYNGMIAIGAIILLMLIFVFGFGRSVADGERGTVSSIYEYSVMIFLMGFMYSGNNKFFKVMLLIIAALYCVQDLIYGGRITSLQMIIMVYLVFFHDKKINLIKIAPLVLLGLLVFSAVGELRGNFNFSIESLVNAFESLLGGSFSLDTAYAAFYASQVFVKVSFLDSWIIKLSNLWAFFASVFFGGRVPNSNLSSYTQNMFWHGGGGLTPFYMYYYLGIGGVLLTAIYIAFLLKKFKWNKSYFSKVIVIYLSCTVPRWYLYSPVSIIRGLLILAILYATCWWCNNILKKRNIVCRFKN